jgi:hypothetical protein
MLEVWGFAQTGMIVDLSSRQTPLRHDTGEFAEATQTVRTLTEKPDRDRLAQKPEQIM